MELKSAVNDWRTLCGVPTVAPKPRQFRPSNQLKKIGESFKRHVDRDDIDRVGAPKLSKADKIDRSGLKATKLRLEIDQQLVEIWRKGELLNRERQLAQWKRAKKAKAAAKKATKRPSEKTFPGAKRSPPSSKSTSPSETVTSSDTGELNRHKKAIELTARASVLTDAETYSLNPNEENKEKFRKTVDYFRQCKGEISPLFAKMRTCYSKAVFGELVSVLEGKEFLLESVITYCRSNCTAEDKLKFESAFNSVLNVFGKEKMGDCLSEISKAITEDMKKRMAQFFLE